MHIKKLLQLIKINHALKFGCWVHTARWAPESSGPHHAKIPTAATDSNYQKEDSILPISENSLRLFMQPYHMFVRIIALNLYQYTSYLYDCEVHQNVSEELF
jgi:hypothetical protein